MKKLFSIMFFCAVIFSGVNAHALDHALKLDVGLGDRHSMAVDLYWQQTWSPWLEGGGFALSPITGVGALLWTDLDGNDYFWVEKGKIGKGADTVWGVFGMLGLKLTYTGEHLQPFVAISSGPSYVSENEFVERDMGGHFIFNNRVMLGFSFGKNFRHEVSFQFAHFSNAGIYKHNRGLNTFSMAYGFTF